MSTINGNIVDLVVGHSMDKRAKVSTVYGDFKVGSFHQNKHLKLTANLNGEPAVPFFGFQHVIPHCISDNGTFLWPDAEV
jgi:hypothetical protein